VESEEILLYRAMCVAEFEDIIQTGVFKSGPNSLEGKWFAERGNHAFAWGKLLFSNEDFCIIQARFPKGRIEEFERWPNLDGIGPARYARLDVLNRAKPDIRRWTA
jgi:hypothetical protein